MPAGPPPTMTTSAGICGRSTPSMGLRKISIEHSTTISQANFFATDEHGLETRGYFIRVYPCDPRRGSLASRLRLLHFLNQRRNDIEKIPDNRIVRDLENRRFGIFIHRDDRPRTFHSDDVLNRPADAQSKIKLGRNGLPR